MNPGELKVLVVRKQDSPKTLRSGEEEPSEKLLPLILPGPFAYSLDEPNALVLDTATWELTPADPLTPARRGDNAEEILKIDQAVRRHFGLEVRGGEMVQPWYAEKFHGEPPVLGMLTLRFAFMVETLPDGPLTLAIERPERFVVTVNETSPQTPLPGARSSLGKGLSDEPHIPLREAGGGGKPKRAGGGWIDACFKLLDVPVEALRVGENVVTLTTEFRRDSDLEAIYLLGDFGVRLDGSKRMIIPLLETLTVGDVCEQGLPFYTGCVTYQLPAFEGELELPEVGGACVRVNGQTIPWPPYTTTIPPFAKPEGGGEERAGGRLKRGEGCDVTVVLTRRNLFGPLHLVPKQQAAYGPGHWVTGGNNWSDDYQLYPAGLLAAPRIRSTSLDHVA